MPKVLALDLLFNLTLAELTTNVKEYFIKSLVELLKLFIRMSLELVEDNDDIP